MSRSTPSARSTFTRIPAWRRRLLQSLAALGLFTLAAPTPGAPPAWWTAPDTKIFTGAYQNNQNWAPVNVGQLKHVAIQARKYLDARLAPAGGAGPVVRAGCQFSNQDNYAPVNVGQLKQVAKLFYDRLAQVGCNWQTGNAGTASTPYPWTGTTNPENAAPANLGQLKNVFSFQINASFTNTDSDADGLPDWWEKFYFGNLSATPSADPDGDGLTNLQEYQHAMSPISTDTDNDGLLDPDEIVFSKDPVVPDHPATALQLLKTHP